MAEQINNNYGCSSCSEVISSNCILWAGGAVNGLNLCGKPSLTDVILGISQNCCTGGGGTTPTPNPCSTGGWTDFSSQIPVTGTGTNCTWTTLTGEFGLSPFGASAEDVPSYKFTASGNLLVRGTVPIAFQPNTPGSSFLITIAKLTPSCLPTNFVASQTILVDVTQFGAASGNTVLLVHFIRAYLRLDKPTNTLQLGVIANFTNGASSGLQNYIITFGGTQFNLE